MKIKTAIFSFVLFAAASSPAFAQLDDVAADAEDMPAAHSHVVTSVQKCLDQLPPAEAAEVRKNYLKPYQECMARLSYKKKDEAEKAAKAAADAPVAPAPRNYVRVRKEPEKPAQEKPADAVKDAEKPAAK